MKKFLVVISCLVLVGGGVAWWMEREGLTVDLMMSKPRGDVEAAVKAWMLMNLADKESEVIMISAPPVSYEGRFYRVVRVRGKNGFGGAVINEFMVIGNTEHAVDDVMTPKEFVASFKVEERSVEELESLRELSATLQKVADATLKKQGG